jgi:hypothetical protein
MARDGAGLLISGGKSVQTASWRPSRGSVLWEAAEDFYLFQNRGYPRTPARDWVGNRYALTSLERELLHRGVLGQKVALQRRAKRCKGSDWLDACLAVDGHNVQITVESALLGRPLLKGNDGALRDLAGQSSRFRMTEISEVAMDAIFRFLEAHRPARVCFLFDAPMSRSGELAARYGARMRSVGLAGEARAVPVPEREMASLGGVAASSDRAVLDVASRWIDLACCCLEAFRTLDLLVDFSPLILSRPGERDPLVAG